MPPIPTPICSDPLAKITSSVASCSETSFGGSTKSSSFESGSCATRLEVFLAKLQILLKGFLGKWVNRCSGDSASFLRTSSLSGSPSVKSAKGTSLKG